MTGSEAVHEFELAAELVRVSVFQQPLEQLVLGRWAAGQAVALSLKLDFLGGERVKKVGPRRVIGLGTDQVLERARCTLQCGGSRPLSRRNTLEARHALLLLEGGLAIEGET